MGRKRIGEKWKEIFIVDADKTHQRIFISENGRVRIKIYNHNTTIVRSFRLSKLVKINNFWYFYYTCVYGKRKEFLIHKAVAICFVNKKKMEDNFVIHKDFNTDNNHYKNLLWVNQQTLNLYRKRADKM